jgi:hypothetical protein
MTYERAFCNRCTNVHYCILVGKSFYCQACFDTVSNDIETKDKIAKIMGHEWDIEQDHLG